MSRKLEQAHDADDGEELEDVGVLQVRGELLQHQVDVEAQRGHAVDDVDRGLRGWWGFPVSISSFEFWFTVSLLISSVLSILQA